MLKEQVIDTIHGIWETMKNRQLIHIKGDTDGNTVKIAIAVK